MKCLDGELLPAHRMKKKVGGDGGGAETLGTGSLSGLVEMCGFGNGATVGQGWASGIILSQGTRLVLLLVPTLLMRKLSLRFGSLPEDTQLARGKAWILLPAYHLTESRLPSVPSDCSLYGHRCAEEGHPHEVNLGRLPGRMGL